MCTSEEYSISIYNWPKTHEHLIVTGPIGTGKTWLGRAFASQAARPDYSVLYIRMPRLFEDLAIARLDGRFSCLIDKLTRIQLFVLDDWGSQGSPSAAAQQRSSAAFC
ncbi:hypothetical protein NRB_07210 [Novosphingobium sp. 11B]